jgi:RES domain-containing protein
LQLPADLPRRQFSGVVHRVVRAGIDPLSTEGSRKAGGRYNPPGDFGALYASLEPETAGAEVARGCRLRGIDPARFAAEDWWEYEIELRAAAILDLTDAAVLERLGLSPTAVTGTDLSVTREIGASARRAGYAGVLVPSAACAGGTNLVIFVDRLEETPVVLRSRPVALPAG